MPFKGIATDLVTLWLVAAGPFVNAAVIPIFRYNVT